MWTEQDIEDIITYIQPCTIRYKRNNKWMNKKNKCRKKVNTNLAGKIRSLTKRFEAFKKLMVSVMTSLLTILSLNLFR